MNRKKWLVLAAIGAGLLCQAAMANAKLLSHPAVDTTRVDTASGSRWVYVIRINGPINPVVAEYIVKSIEDATDEDAECLIIEMDTPGGLMESTRIITKAMLASKIPIVVYVAPSGARAASAGVFITYAAHIAAMTTSTNIGAAHPVNIGGGEADSSNTMMEKVTNDAVAQIKTVAEKRGRNVEWAEEAVRKSVSITEKEALEKNVINFIAPDLDSLLVLAHGREVELGNNRKVKLNTAGAKIARFEMNWRYKLLDKISDPNIAYILLLLGIYGIFFELSNPGAILPGVLGGIFLILGFYALQTLPVNWAGLLLILFAIILFILETQITSYGILTIGGVVAMFLGSVMLFSKPTFTFEPVIKVSLQVIITATLVTAAFFAFALGLAVKAHRMQVTTGKEGMIGEIGTALTDLKPEGRVQVHGEIWQAHSEIPIEKEQAVKVVAISGLRVKVEKAG
jgi:membrane-bound serine protease (ClpP class)